MHANRAGRWLAGRPTKHHPAIRCRGDRLMVERFGPIPARCTNSFCQRVELFKGRGPLRPASIRPWNERRLVRLWMSGWVLEGVLWMARKSGGLTRKLRNS